MCLMMEIITVKYDEVILKRYTILSDALHFVFFGIYSSCFCHKTKYHILFSIIFWKMKDFFSISPSMYGWLSVTRTFGNLLSVSNTFPVPFLVLWNFENLSIWQLSYPWIICGYRKSSYVINNLKLKILKMSEYICLKNNLI